MATSLPHFNLVASPCPWLRLRGYSCGCKSPRFKHLQNISIVCAEVYASWLQPAPAQSEGAKPGTNSGGETPRFEMAQPQEISLVLQRGWIMHAKYINGYERQLVA